MTASSPHMITTMSRRRSAPSRPRNRRYRLMRYRLALGAVGLALSSAPALADDCADITAAMITTAHTPYRTLITRTGPDGKPVTSEMIQTLSAQYIQQNGKWVTMPLSPQKMIDHIQR